jgi:hypothetical protein
MRIRSNKRLEDLLTIETQLRSILASNKDKMIIMFMDSNIDKIGKTRRKYEETLKKYKMKIYEQEDNTRKCYKH